MAGLRASQGRHRSVAFDVTDDDAVASGVAEARALLGGRIDILVNSAGILSEASVLEMTPKMWNQTCLLYTSPSPRDRTRSRMPSSA